MSNSTSQHQSVGHTCQYREQMETISVGVVSIITVALIITAINVRK